MLSPFQMTALLAAAALAFAGCANPATTSNPVQTNTFKPIWARTLVSGTNYSSFAAVAAGRNGNVYTAGSLSGTAGFEFGDVIVSGSGGGTNGLLIRYNASGTVAWARSVDSGSETSTFYAVAADSEGNVYAAGMIVGVGELSFGNNVSVSGTAGTGGGSVLLVKYNEEGVAQWARTASMGAGNSYFSAITVDSSGDVYAAGLSNNVGTFDFGDDVTATATGTDGSSKMVLVKYDAEGKALWARSALETGTSTNSRIYALAAGSGNVYAAGAILSGTYDFGNSVTVDAAFDGDNGLLVQYDGEGTPQWARTTTAEAEDFSFGKVAVDSAGNVYVVGGIYDAATIGFGSGVSATGTYGGSNAILVQYNSGTAQWARTVSGSTAVSFNALAAGSDGVFVAGSLNGTTPADFGNGVTATGTYSGASPLLAQYDSAGTAQRAWTPVSGSSHSIVYGLALTPDSMFAVGNLVGKTARDLGNGVSVTGAYQNSNPLIVKFNR